MKTKFLYYIIICASLYSCSTKAQKANNVVERCTIIEENFESTSMKKFLKTTTIRRDIIDKFINDNSTYSILSIENMDVFFASFNGEIWNVYHNDRTYTISDKDFTTDLEFYANKETVYKVHCPEDYVVYDSNEPFKAIWIKKSSKIKFLYYSTKCEIVCLNNDEQKKITRLKSIVERLK